MNARLPEREAPAERDARPEYLPRFFNLSPDQFLRGTEALAGNASGSMYPINQGVNMNEPTLNNPHASELSRLQRQAGSHVKPGSLLEAQALGRIDDARIDEENALRDTSSRRRRRSMKHWSDRGAQLDGR